jgi:hypothetical protein
MLYADLFSSFIGSYNEGDIKSASIALMRELGNILVKKKDDFVHLLNDSEIPATIDMTDVRLVDLFVQNVPNNPKLALGASLLVNTHNKEMGFDGEGELNDDCVKAGYSCIMSYFNDEGYSNAIDPVTAIAQGVGELSKLGTTIASGQQKKKYGSLDAAQQKQAAKSAMIQQILAQRQAQLETSQKEKESRAKTTKTLLIVSGVVVGLAIIGLVIYKIKNKRK